MIELRSTLHALSNNDFICSICQGKYEARPDGKQMLEKVKRVKGCESITSNLRHFIIQGNTKLSYNTCIGNFVNDSSIYWINFYNHFEKGVMPFGGGYMDQPAKVIDVMSVVGSHKSDELSKASQKRKQSSRQNVRMINRGR